MKYNAIAFFLTFLAFTSSPYSYSNTTDIAGVFKAGEIEIKQASVSAWAKLQEPYDSSNMESIAMLVSEHMGARFTESEVCNEIGEKGVYKGNYECGSICLKIENKYNSTLKKNEAVIIIDITQYGKFWNITNIGDTVTRCLKELGSGPPATIYMEGFVEGEIPKPRREKMINSMITGLEASIIESINTDNLISVCGYTGKIKDYIKSKDRKINVNIASRYSPCDKKTYFWIGTPVLNIEY